MERTKSGRSGDIAATDRDSGIRPRRTADRRGAAGPAPAGNLLGPRARDAGGSSCSVRDGRLGLLCLEAEQTASAAGAPLEAPPLVAEGPAGTATRGPDEAPSEEGEPATPFRREPQRLVSAERAPDEPEKVTEEPGEVDRVMLAKEFSGLLQLNEDGDEDNS